MSNLAEFKEHIIKLRQFFSGLHAYVDAIDHNDVGEFLTSATKLSSNDLSDAAHKYYLKVRSPYILRNSWS